MDDRSEDLAHRLHGFLVEWLQANPGWAYRHDSTNWILELRDTAELSQEFLNSADFQEVRLAAFLRSPDGQLVRTVVGWILPWPESAEFRLLVDAILLASNAKQRDQRVLVGALTVLASLMFLLGGMSD